MSLVAAQWLVVAAFFGVRLLAPGWLLAFGIMFGGVLPLGLLGPLVTTAYLAPGTPTAAFAVADAALLAAALCIPDFGDTSEFFVPALRIVRFGGTPAMARESRAIPVLSAIGVLGLLTYIGSLPVMWFVI
ncbi:MAG TPA: hypothetical protein VFU65_14125 [Actinocrinis sp.]|nr:hypothetical protein [Actinocrinis sp.]